MKFDHSSDGVVIAKTKDRRSKGLSANIAAVSTNNNLTITVEAGDNPKSIYSTAARVLGKGAYSVRVLEKVRANSPERYQVSTI